MDALQAVLAISSAIVGVTVRVAAAGAVEIGSYGMIVAATALERASQVATFDARHFDVVPSLTTIEPR